MSRVATHHSRWAPRGVAKTDDRQTVSMPWLECRLVQLTLGQPGMSYAKTTPQVSHDEWLAGKPGFGNFVSVWSGANDKRVTLGLPSDMIDPTDPCGTLPPDGESERSVNPTKKSSWKCFGGGL